MQGAAAWGIVFSLSFLKNTRMDVLIAGCRDGKARSGSVQGYGRIVFSVA
jgi:hypothetical protein